jgi:hypothetical protein
MPEKRQALLEHGRRLPCCVPYCQVWSSDIAKLPTEAGPGWKQCWADNRRELEQGWPGALIPIPVVWWL